MAEDKTEAFIKLLVDIEERLATLETEMDALKARLAVCETQSGIGEEAHKKQEDLARLHQTVKDLHETASRSGNHINQLERRVDHVKRDSNSGLVLSIVFFSILFIIALFTR
ncbi:MAG: hypothetical protein HQL58_02790 [Magnetococcales bacterium]|nr:hypothetical protein [Magnetococcales bacterium]